MNSAHFKLNCLLMGLMGLLLACGSPESTGDAETPLTDSLAPAPIPGPVQPLDDFQQYTGILRSSGLQPQEAQALGLGQHPYQLISQKAYLFQGHDSLKAYVGSCISLRVSAGKSPDSLATGRQTQTTYGREILAVQAMQVLPQGRCYYSDTLQTQPQGQQLQFSGRIRRMERPAPDIAYDYQIELTKPYRDNNHPVQPGMLVKSLPLVTDDFNTLNALEQAVKEQKALHLSGVLHQGYAESQALWVTSIESSAL